MNITDSPSSINDINAVSILNRCNKQKKAPDDIDQLLTHLNALIRGNIIALIVSLIALLICIFAIGYICNMAFNVISAYFMKIRDGKRHFFMASDTDNYTYKSGSNSMEVPRASEYALLASNMSDLRAKYSGYNRAMTQYLSKKGMTNDDAIDESILLSEQDNFDYSNQNATPKI